MFSHFGPPCAHDWRMARAKTASNQLRICLRIMHVRRIPKVSIFMAVINLAMRLCSQTVVIDQSCLGSFQPKGQHVIELVGFKISVLQLNHFFIYFKRLVCLCHLWWSSFSSVPFLPLQLVLLFWWNIAPTYLVSISISTCHKYTVVSHAGGVQAGNAE